MFVSGSCESCCAADVVRHQSAAVPQAAKVCTMARQPSSMHTSDGGWETGAN